MLLDDFQSFPYWPEKEWKPLSLAVSRFFCFRECCKLVQFCIPMGSNWFGPQWRNFCRGSWWLGSSWVNLSAGPSILQSRMHWLIYIQMMQVVGRKSKEACISLHWLPHSTCPRPMSDHLWVLWIVIFSRLGFDSRWRSLATGLVNNLERKQRNWSKTSWALEMSLPRIWKLQSRIKAFFPRDGAFVLVLFSKCSLCIYCPKELPSLSYPFLPFIELKYRSLRTVNVAIIRFIVYCDIFN